MKKKSTLFIVVFSISILLIFYSAFIIRENYQYEKENIFLKDTNLDLNRLKRKTNITLTIQKELNLFYGLLTENSLQPQDLENYCSKLNKKYPFIKLIFFDKKQNRIIFGKKDNDSLYSPMQRLYSALYNYKVNKDNTLLKRYNSLFLTLLGTVNTQNIANDTSTLIPVTFNSKQVYFYWNIIEGSNENTYGMIAWFKEEEISRKQIIETVIDKENASITKQGIQKFGLVDFSTDKYNIYPKELTSINENELGIKIQELKQSLKKYEIFNDYLLIYEDIENNSCLFLLTNKQNYLFSWIILIAFYLTTIFLLVYSIYKLYNYQFFMQDLIKVDNSIRILDISLGFVFLLIIFLIFTITNYTFNKNNCKSQLTQTNLETAVRLIDNNYEQSKKNLCQKLVTISNNKDLLNNNVQGIDTIIDFLQKEGITSKIFISNTLGEIKYSYPKKIEVVYNKILPFLTKKISSRRFETSESWQSKLDSLMIDTVSKSITDIFGDEAIALFKAFEKFDTVNEFEIGKKRYLAFSTIIKSRNEPEILILWLDANDFSKNYLINIIKDSENLPDNLRNIIFAMIPIKLDSAPYPREITKYSFARDITEQIAYSKNNTFFKTQIEGKAYFGYGSILKSIPNYILFALQQE